MVDAVPIHQGCLYTAAFVIEDSVYLLTDTFSLYGECLIYLFCLGYLSFAEDASNSGSQDISI